MAKYYIALLNESTQQMLVPIKTVFNPFYNHIAFCAGMPQFFGGSDNDDAGPIAVLDREISEESRHTLELVSPQITYFFHTGNVYAGSMDFYYADQPKWQTTDTPWQQPANGAEAEMDRIVTVELSGFRINMTDDDLINELLRQTGCLNPQLPGWNDFSNSATRSVFIALLRGLAR
ncbi:MAG TPA: hypothetical protein VF271_10085 [Rhodanobacteraceae bacterium]